MGVVNPDDLSTEYCCCEHACLFLEALFDLDQGDLWPRPMWPIQISCLTPDIREGVNSYFRRTVPGFEGVSSTLHTGPCISGSSPWMYAQTEVECTCSVSLYRQLRKVPMNVWAVLQNRSLLLLWHSDPFFMGPHNIGLTSPDRQMESDAYKPIVHKHVWAKNLARM